MKNLVKNCMFIANQVGTFISKRTSTYEKRITTRYSFCGNTEQLARYNKMLYDLIWNELANDPDEELEFLAPDYCPCCGQFRGFTLVHTTAVKFLF